MVKLFKCLQCPRIFEKYNELRTHQRYHVKLHKCTKCSRSYIRLFDFKRHMVITHSIDIQTFDCNFCSEKFSNFTQLNNHIAVHTKERYFMCHICQTYFTNALDLKQHKQEEHNIFNMQKPPKLHYCYFCNKGMKALVYLEAHLRGHTTEKPYKCSKCPAACKEKYALKNHIEKHAIWKYSCSHCNKPLKLIEKLLQHEAEHVYGKNHTKRIYKCSLCSKSFVKLSGLKNHARNHNRELVDKCKLCNKMFNGTSSLLCHQVQVHQKKVDKLINIYTCYFCGKLFASNVDFAKHIATHTKEKPLKCPKCNFVCNRPLGLKTHMKRHGTNTKEFLCYFCQESYVTLQELNRHIAVHTGEILHACAVCKQQFRSKWNLATHIKLNHENTYTCQICQETFMQLTSFKKHLVTHKPDQYTCKICNKSFAKLSTHNRHQIHHVADRPFKCNKCDYTSKYNWNLSAHKQNVHKLISKFQSCYFCKNNFTSYIKLDNHIRIHTTEEPFKCSLCPSTFKLLENLYRHKLLHENSKYFGCKYCNMPIQGKERLLRHEATYIHGKTHKYRIRPCPFSIKCQQ